MNTKLCHKCQSEKPTDQFYNDKRSYCIECERSLANERMKKFNATMRGKASQALASTRKQIRRLGIDVEDDLTLHDVLFTFAMADGECSYCGKKVDDYQLDHIIPLSEGGPNTFSNITVACPSCNSSKHNKNVLEWHAFNKKIPNENILALIERIAVRRGVSPEQVKDELQESEGSRLKRG
jgi:5-methylcytosine-specific restriction endonuclease McrA